MSSLRCFVAGGVARNVFTLCRIAAAVALVLTLIALPFRGRRIAAATTARVAYDFSPVSLPGYSHSGAVAVNNKGTVIGLAWNDGEPTLHPFVYQSGKAAELRRPKGAEDCIAVDINDRGDIAGAALMKDKTIVGVFWRTDKSVMTFSRKGRYVLPQALNAGGIIVGIHQEPGCGNLYTAFQWTPGKMRDLGDFDAFAVNAAGDVAGCRISGSENPRLDPIYYRAGKGREILPRPGGFAHGIASAINDAGECAGAVFNGNDDLRAMLWTQGRARMLSRKPSLALSLNNRGQAVGMAVRDFLGEAVLWDGKNETFLQDAAPRKGGWNYLAAVGVNESGQIVGTGTANDRFQGFLLTPK